MVAGNEDVVDETGDDDPEVYKHQTVVLDAVEVHYKAEDKTEAAHKAQKARKILDDNGRAEVRDNEDCGATF